MVNKKTPLDIIYSALIDLTMSGDENDYFGVRTILNKGCGDSDRMVKETWSEEERKQIKIRDVPGLLEALVSIGKAKKIIAQVYPYNNPFPVYRAIIE